MRELEKGEIAVQIWSHDHPQGDIQAEVQRVTNSLTEKGLGRVTEIEGPTPHIPDYFSELYGTILGFIIYLADCDPATVKRHLIELETTDGRRTLDIDVYLDYFKKVSRRDANI